MSSRDADKEAQQSDPARPGDARSSRIAQNAKKEASPRKTATLEAPSPHEIWDKVSDQGKTISKVKAGQKELLKEATYLRTKLRQREDENEAMREILHDSGVMRKSLLQEKSKEASDARRRRKEEAKGAEKREKEERKGRANWQGGDDNENDDEDEEEKRGEAIEELAPVLDVPAEPELAPPPPPTVDEPDSAPPESPTGSSSSKAKLTKQKSGGTVDWKELGWLSPLGPVRDVPEEEEPAPTPGPHVSFSPESGGQPKAAPRKWKKKVNNNLFDVTRPFHRFEKKDKDKPKLPDGDTRAKHFYNFEECLRRGNSPHSWEGPLTPVLAMVKSDEPELVDLLIRGGASPNERVPSEKGVAILHMATFLGNLPMIKAILNNKGDPNVPDKFGQTPLFFAARPVVASTLFEFKADPTVMNVKAQTALHLAARAGHESVLKWMLQHVSREVLDLKDKHGASVTYYARSAGVTHALVNRIHIHEPVYDLKNGVSSRALTKHPHFIGEDQIGAGPASGQHKAHPTSHLVGKANIQWDFSDIHQDENKERSKEYLKRKTAMSPLMKKLAKQKSKEAAEAEAAEAEKNKTQKLFTVFEGVGATGDFYARKQKEARMQDQAARLIQGAVRRSVMLKEIEKEKQKMLREMEKQIEKVEKRNVKETLVEKKALEKQKRLLENEREVLKKQMDAKLQDQLKAQREAFVQERDKVLEAVSRNADRADARIEKAREQTKEEIANERHKIRQEMERKVRQETERIAAKKNQEVKNLEMELDRIKAEQQDDKRRREERRQRMAEQKQSDEAQRKEQALRKEEDDRQTRLERQRARLEEQKKALMEAEQRGKLEGEKRVRDDMERLAGKDKDMIATMKQKADLERKLRLQAERDARMTRVQASKERGKSTVISPTEASSLPAAAKSPVKPALKIAPVDLEALNENPPVSQSSPARQRPQVSWGTPRTNPTRYGNRMPQPTRQMRGPGTRQRGPGAMSPRSQEARDARRETTKSEYWEGGGEEEEDEDDVREETEQERKERVAVELIQAKYRRSVVIRDLKAAPADGAWAFCKAVRNEQAVRSVKEAKKAAEERKEEMIKDTYRGTIANKILEMEDKSFYMKQQAKSLEMTVAWERFIVKYYDYIIESQAKEESREWLIKYGQRAFAAAKIQAGYRGMEARREAARLRAGVNQRSAGDPSPKSALKNEASPKPLQKKAVTGLSTKSTNGLMNEVEEALKEEDGEGWNELFSIEGESKLSVVNEQEEDVAREAAAVKIQALARGGVSRKNTKQVKARKDEAATKIQAVQRGNVARTVRINMEAEKAAEEFGDLNFDMDFDFGAAGEIDGENEGEDEEFGDEFGDGEEAGDGDEFEEEAGDENEVDEEAGDEEGGDEEGGDEDDAQEEGEDEGEEFEADEDDEDDGEGF